LVVILLDIDQIQQHQLVSHLDGGQACFEVDVLDILDDEPEEWCCIRHEFCFADSTIGRRGLQYLVKLTLHDFDGVASVFPLILLIHLV
jgi:hypothetical protein